MNPSALDGRRVESGAVGVARQERGERHRSVRRELELGETLLAEAVVEPPLESAQLALRYAICRPGRVGELRAGLLGEVRQVLQPDALAVLAVAGGAGEVVRPAAEIEHLLAQLVRLPLLRVAPGNVHRHAPRFGGDPGGEGFQVRTIGAGTENALGRILEARPLQRGHAVHEPRFQVHDAVRVGEMARHLGVRALHHARALAEVAGLQRRFLRTALFLPERFAARLPQFRRVARGERLPVLGDFRFRAALGRSP